MEGKEMEEREVDLRDYIRVILKRKAIILTVFFVAVIATAIVSLYIPRVYQATTSIMIMPSRMQAALSPMGTTLGHEHFGPVLSVPTNEALLKSTVVLEKIIDSLKLTDRLGEILGPDELSKRLDIELIRETNILRLKAEDNDPKMAREIANAWAEGHIKYSQELISGEVRGAGDFIVDQFEIARQNLTQTEEKIKDFKNKYNVDLVQAELNIKKGKLNRNKEESVHLGIALKTKEDSLRELKKQIEKQERFIIVSKAITDDALWQKILKGGGTADLDKSKLRSEVINPVYQDLKTRIVNTGIELNILKPRFEHLKESIELTRKEIDELERTINQGRFELTQLTRQAEIYKRTHDNLSIKIEEARIAKAMQLGEVRVVSFASEPRDPIEPKKGLMVAISSVVSLMLGTFLAFFVEYWKKI